MDAVLAALHRRWAKVRPLICCCFGGSDLETLYVTSAAVRLNEEMLNAAPLSGSLFAIRVPGVRGLPETTFAG